MRAAGSARHRAPDERPAPGVVIADADERAVLRGLEADWQNAIAAIRDTEEERWREFRAWQSSSDKRAYRLGRGLLVAMGVLVAVLVASVLVLSAQSARLARQADNAAQIAMRLDGVVRAQQRNRFAAVREACEDRNRIAGGIRGFIHAVSPQLDVRADRTFRQEPSCAAYARSILATGKPPRGSP